MVNPWAGEAALTLDGRVHVLKLTLGALAELEAQLHAEGLIDLIERFEAGKYRSRDLIALLCAGLRGGGWDGSVRDLASADIEGGAIEASQVAARLLALAFGPVGGSA